MIFTKFWNVERDPQINADFPSASMTKFRTKNFKISQFTAMKIFPNSRKFAKVNNQISPNPNKDCQIVKY